MRAILTMILILAPSLSFRAFARSDTPRMVVAESPEERAVHEAVGQRFMISTQGKAASEAAMRMFRKGGNIIDAATAASFAIAVERPQSSGLGGGGFLIFHEARTGRNYAVDFRERAPGLATEGMFLDPKGDVVPGLSSHGVLSVAVPGTVAGLTEIHKKFGSLPLEVVIQPAIELAKYGLIVYPALAAALESQKSNLSKYESSKKVFLKESGEPYRIGERLIQADLAESLRLIANQGSKAFYRGAIAKAIIQQSEKFKGLLSQQDLEQYRVKWRKPVVSEWKHMQIISMPPPSSGGTHVIEILNMLEKDHLGLSEFASTKSIHLITSALQQAFADRANFMGDPDFVEVPFRTLISKQYALKARAAFDSNKARPASAVAPGKIPTFEHIETTHFSIMDKNGNAVSSTQTINGYFGSGIVAEGTGIVLNDEMDDFTAKVGDSNQYGAVGGKNNSIVPGKTPLSSMSPTIILKNLRPIMAVGAPGGTRIISCVAETILNYFAYALPLYESVNAVRFHNQWLPDKISVDSPGFTDDTNKELKKMGYAVETSPDGVPCRVMAVTRENNGLHGVSDPRDAGSSGGI